MHRSTWRTSPLRTWRNRVLAAALLVLAGAAAAVLLRPGQDRESGETRVPDPRVTNAMPLPGLGSSRPIEGRLSYDGADHYRPYAVQRSARTVRVDHIPLAALARLEKRGDAHAVAAAHVLMGSHAQAAIHLDRARQAADTAGAVDDADNDHALLALIDGEPEAALDILEGVLARAPRHPQALWNRALALRALGLSRMAARAFDRVAALGEPGWHEEARAQAERLRQPLAAHEATWDRLLARGRELVATGAGLTAADVATLPGLVRGYFYEAVRAAPTHARVAALRPMARALDAHYGGAVLTDYLDRVLGSDFDRRASLARDYAKIAAGPRHTPRAARALVARARRAGPAAADIALGAMRYTAERKYMVAGDLLPTYRRMAADRRDPWFVLLAAEEQAEAHIRRGDYTGAERVLVPVLPACERAGIDFRCLRIELWLGAAYAGLHRLSAAHRHLSRGWARARRMGDWMAGRYLLEQLSEIAYRHDESASGSIAVARAYLGEFALRDRSCDTLLRRHENLAVMLVTRNRLAAARREMERAAALVADGTCEAQPFNLKNGFVQAYLLSHGGSDAEVAALQARIEEFRQTAEASPGRLALVDYFEGRLLIERDRPAALALLARAIERADRLPLDDISARRARSHGYMLRIIDASEHGEDDRALSILAEELGVAAPARCVVGIAAEHALLLVARGAGGALVSRRRPRDAERIPAAHVVPEDIRRTLAGCEVVDVLARSPYYGNARLLPSAVAWRFRTRRTAPVAPRPEPRRVVVADVQPPASLRLPRLRPHPAEPGAEVLRGAAATPAAVLAAIEDATEIEIHAHGLIDSDFADASFLALSPGTEGQYTLTVDDIREQPLTGASLVILGACHAAYTTRFFHNPSSLASAFIEAGARTVIASPAPIPDADAGALFAALRRRITAGQPAAVALRDERQRSIGENERDWLDEIVIFE